MSKLFGFRYEKKEQEKEQADPAQENAVFGEPDEIDTKGETETFWTRNVRLITFLICLAVFLAVLGPISVFRIIDYIEENRAVGETLTVEALVSYAERHEGLKLSEFEAYEKEVSEGEGAILYTIEVGTDYLVMVGATDEDGLLNCFTVTKIKTNETVDVMEKNYSLSMLDALLGR